jgi:hypothetical protein
MRKILSLIAVTLVLAITQRAEAWDSKGHMMVAAVAYSKLKPEIRTKVDALLRVNPDRPNWLDLIPTGTSAADRKKMIFMIAATWPDRIKKDTDYTTDGPHNGNRPPSDPTIANQNTGYDDMHRHKYWHFVDTGFSNDGTAVQPLPTPNAQTQIIAFRDVLASATASKDKKSYDLSWLLHLVGDVHQPLHATARFTALDTDGDDGGNGVELSSGNLHSFWDDVLGSTDNPAIALTAVATLPAADATKANDADVSHWIAESFTLAKSGVYMKPPIGDDEGPFTLSLTYKANAKVLAQKQIALAGARLANLLNEALK